MTQAGDEGERHAEPIPVAALADQVGMDQGQLSRLIAEDAITAPQRNPANPHGGRLVYPNEVARVARVVNAARGVGIPPTTLLRWVSAGRARVLDDGRVILGESSADPERVAATAGAAA